MSPNSSICPDVAANLSTNTSTGYAISASLSSTVSAIHDAHASWVAYVRFAALMITDKPRPLVTPSALLEPVRVLWITQVAPHAVAEAVNAPSLVIPLAILAALAPFP